MQMQTETLAFNRREAADVLRVSLRTLDYLVANGSLQARHIGRRVVIPRVEVEKFLCQNTLSLQRVDCK